MLCFSCKLINPCIDHLLMNYYEEKESVLVPFVIIMMLVINLLQKLFKDLGLCLRLIYD